jgi:SAM-dependent methyltransferase
MMIKNALETLNTPRGFCYTLRLREGGLAGQGDNGSIMIRTPAIPGKDAVMAVTQGRSPSTSLSPPELLLSLYREQRKLRPNDAYLAAHSAEKVARTQAAVFDFYARHLPARGRVLDWGCRHAPDACLMRARFGDALQIDACDLVEPGQYGVFHEWADVRYQPLRDIVHLPYEDQTFDAVVGSGTLEHTAMDYESLKELHRVLKPNGRVIVLYLPNWLSLAEWYLRVIRRRGFHRRLYGLGEIRQLLKRSGFYPLTAGYQMRLDALADQSLKYRLMRAVSWLLPLHWFSSTICTVAVKVQSM